MGDNVVIPTDVEWKEMVRVYGYKKAVSLLNCDLDDVPGIEQTWLENWETLKEDFEKTHRRFFAWLKEQKNRSV